MSAKESLHARENEIWQKFGELLVQETKETFDVDLPVTGSSDASEVEAVALALAQAEINSPAGIRRKTRKSGTNDEIERLRREQMATVQAMLAAEAERKHIDIAIERHNAKVASSAALDASIEQASEVLRNKLRSAPQTVREKTLEIEQKEAKLRRLLKAADHLSVFEGEAQRCAAEYEQQMDRIMRRASNSIAAVVESGAQPDGEEDSGGSEFANADPLPDDIENLLRNFSAALAGGDNSSLWQPSEGDEEAVVPLDEDIGTDGQLVSPDSLESGQRAAVLQRFDRMMRLFATSCAMEARKIITTAQQQTDREYEQALGSVLLDVRREHLREIDQMRQTIDQAHEMLQQLGDRTHSHH